MDKCFISKRTFCILSGLGGVGGQVLIMPLFAINGGPPSRHWRATELSRFLRSCYDKFVTQLAQIHTDDCASG